MRLTEIELQSHVPPCHYCGKPIPPERASSGRYKTCSDDHARLLRQWNRFKKGRIRCKACLRPSTPEERTEFKAWRMAMKGLQAHGRPPVGRNRTMRGAIEAAMMRLRDLADTGVDFEYDESTHQVLCQLEKALKLMPQEPAIIAPESA